MDYYSYRKYTLQGNNKFYNDGDIIKYIEWYDNDYEVTIEASNVKIENIGENILKLRNDEISDLVDIWICDIIEIR